VLVSLRQASSPPSFEVLRPNPQCVWSPQRGQNRLKTKMRFMKHLIDSRAGVLLATGLGAGLLLAVRLNSFSRRSCCRRAPNRRRNRMFASFDSRKVETDPLDGHLPDQSHAMADVAITSRTCGSLRKTELAIGRLLPGRNALAFKMAVRIHPVRKTKGRSRD